MAGFAGAVSGLLRQQQQAAMLQSACACAFARLKSGGQKAAAKRAKQISAQTKPPQCRFSATLTARTIKFSTKAKPA
ncbi:MAG: hypothetical protein DU429_01350 [Candidatus Tokpelaia sp.]|nr:MAG: hypothetical protein DU430_02980 [Candidatus Tokpelaia sp.]KAA6207708.1 MAG: hypothetical protein DU429_01350 [Candidatus Tokpelaia sp.]KAA6404882.1 hypothetical protein DPQ22_08285 [Candidatus Tokpelaia sp.]